MTESLSGKRVWLIGAGSGIGRELVLQLAGLNNRVAISGRKADSLAGVIDDAAGMGLAADSVVAVVCDTTESAETGRAASEVQQLLGGIDIIIYCAGRCEYIDDAALETDLFRRVYDVNVFGLVNVLQSAMPILRQSAGRPLIAGVASLSAVVGLPRAEAYGSSKAAMIYLLDSLRVDLANSSIDVSVINPGFVETPMTAQNDFPMPFLMQADAAADCIIRGLARRKRTINFPLRLWLVLKFAATFPALWYRFIAPRMARTKHA